MVWMGVDESSGGSGGEVIDACHLLRQAGRFAVPLPLAECTLLGGWMIERSGLHIPDGPATVPVARGADSLVLEDGHLRGRLTSVPWGGLVTTVVAIADSSEGERAVLIDPSTAVVISRFNVAGEPRDELMLDGVGVASERIGAACHGLRRELTLRGALSRVLLMAGALESVSELTVDYANQRKQFGRSIASFQAVGNRLAKLCAEVESSSLAAEVAAQRFADVGVDAEFDIAAAKANVSLAASAVATDAHQIHGAVGMTQEYPLHRYTRRLWSWRQEWGSERSWSESLGRLVHEIEPSRLWPKLTTGLSER
jgi:acyl-CoA dehydrogenase